MVDLLNHAPDPLLAAAVVGACALAAACVGIMIVCWVRRALPQDPL
jgi:hypothetical protein